MKRIVEWSAVVGVGVGIVLVCGLAACSKSESHSKPMSSDSPWAATASIDLGGGVAMEFVLVGTGSFTMGSEKNDDEKPVHNVTICQPFYVGKYEVTQEQWERVMGNNPSRFKHAQAPVESVSWDDCQKFIGKLKDKVPGREWALPTEAQWEYACRAGTKTGYYYGDGEGRLSEYAWYNNRGLFDHILLKYFGFDRTTRPVGKKKPNAWGLYDMHGNVWEWCQDVYHENYRGAPADGSAWTQGGRPARVSRGGAWINSPDNLRAASRFGDGPEIARADTGLRCVVLLGGVSGK